MFTNFRERFTLIVAQENRKHFHLAHLSVMAAPPHPPLPLRVSPLEVP